MIEDIVLECRKVNHWFETTQVLYDIDIRIIRGEIVGIVGPSGCGKSTLLRAIVGTHPLKQGSVIIRSPKHPEGKEVTAPGRDRGIVYQNYSLFPFLTAVENVAFGLMLDQTSIPFRLLGLPKWWKLRKKHLSEANGLLEKLNLGDAGTLYPHEMSGGMKQRVAIAQALIMKPQILLLDEPFGALDEATREDLQRMLLTLYQENLDAKKSGQLPPYTILIVTHELNEAIYVGDRVIAITRYWDWKAEGLKSSPGSTVVFDQIAPVFSPEQERNFDVFSDERSTIRDVAFNPKTAYPRSTYSCFWEQINNGKGEGILK
jgi:NitT/TauT family transport system ATP-binding protein